MIALIGSKALEIRSPELLQKKPMDYDFICTYDEYKETFAQHKWDQLYPIQDGKKIIAKKGDLICEIEIAWEGTNAYDLLCQIKHDIKSVLSPNMGIKFDNEWLNIPWIFIPSFDVLYMLKMSHRYLKNSPHFLKTMNDIIAMRKEGAKIPDEYSELYKAREKETYNYKHPNLNQMKGNFFDPNQGVTYVYDHDTIHLAMAHLEKPAYSYFKHDEADVKVSKKKFLEDIPLKTQLYSVLEESYVLALERSQIPFPGKITPRKSFEIALMKVCTSISSGWWREWAYDHYYEALALYDENYVDKFNKAVEDGIVKKFNQ